MTSKHPSLVRHSGILATGLGPEEAECHRHQSSNWHTEAFRLKSRDSVFSWSRENFSVSSSALGLIGKRSLQDLPGQGFVDTFLRLAQSLLLPYLCVKG